MKIIYKSQVKNPKLGFYEVGKDIFYNKVEALEAATRLKIPFSAVHWNFNDEVFKTINWSVEPDLPLKSFYELRARQLREKYDYILVNNLVCETLDPKNMFGKTYIDESLKKEKKGKKREEKFKKFKEFKRLRRFRKYMRFRR